jgi:hypothetical protein
MKNPLKELRLIVESMIRQNTIGPANNQRMDSMRSNTRPSEKKGETAVEYPYDS